MEKSGGECCGKWGHERDPAEAAAVWSLPRPAV